MRYESGVKTDAGYLALPPSGTGPGVLVLHAWWGLSEFFVQLCDRLAKEGYVVLAPDLFNGAVARTIPEAEALSSLSERDNYQATKQKVEQAFNDLLQQPAVQGRTVGVMGFSFGGWWTLQLSAERPEQVGAAILIYGDGEADFAAARCAYQVHCAENDPYDPLEMAQAMESAMRAAGREVTLYIYPGVGHWFFESNQPVAYDAAAAQLAWDRILSFLKSQLGGGEA